MLIFHITPDECISLCSHVLFSPAHISSRMWPSIETYGTPFEAAPANDGFSIHLDLHSPTSGLATSSLVIGWVPGTETCSESSCVCWLSWPSSSSGGEDVFWWFGIVTSLVFQWESSLFTTTPACRACIARSCDSTKTTFLVTWIWLLVLSQQWYAFKLSE